MKYIRSLTQQNEYFEKKVNGKVYFQFDGKKNFETRILKNDDSYQGNSIFDLRRVQIGWEAQLKFLH